MGDLLPFEDAVAIVLSAEGPRSFAMRGVMIVLLQERDPATGQCERAVKSICSALTISENTTREAIRELIADGWIELVPKANGLVNRYTLHTPPRASEGMDLEVVRRRRSPHPDNLKVGGTPSQIEGVSRGTPSQIEGVSRGTPSQIEGVSRGTPSQIEGVSRGTPSQIEGVSRGTPSQIEGVSRGTPSQIEGVSRGTPSQIEGVSRGTPSQIEGVSRGTPSQIEGVSRGTPSQIEGVPPLAQPVLFSDLRDQRSQSREEGECEREEPRSTVAPSPAKSPALPSSPKPKTPRAAIVTIEVLTPEERAVFAALSDDPSLAPISRALPSLARDLVKLALPGVNVVREICKAGAWCRANPRKAPTANGNRFITTWISRAIPEESPEPAPVAPPPAPAGPRSPQAPRSPTDGLLWEPPYIPEVAAKMAEMAGQPASMETIWNSCRQIAGEIPKAQRSPARAPLKLPPLPRPLLPPLPEEAYEAAFPRRPGEVKHG